LPRASENIDHNSRRFIDNEVNRLEKRSTSMARPLGAIPYFKYCGLDHRLIKKATDANPEKWGLRTPRNNIPLFPRLKRTATNPDYSSSFPSLLEEIREEEDEYLRSGGKLIVPLPQFRIVTA